MFGLEGPIQEQHAPGALEPIQEEEQNLDSVEGLEVERQDPMAAAVSCCLLLLLGLEASCSGERPAGGLSHGAAQAITGH
jgi:hypothetical protein